MSEWKRNENGINSDECAEEIKEEIMIRIVELPVHPGSGRPITAGGGGRRRRERYTLCSRRKRREHRPYAPADNIGLRLESSSAKNHQCQRGRSISAIISSEEQINGKGLLQRPNTNAQPKIRRCMVTFVSRHMHN